MTPSAVKHALRQLEGGLIEELLASAGPYRSPKAPSCCAKGAYVRDLPLVLDGLVRVYLGHEDKGCALLHPAGGELRDEPVGPARACTEPDLPSRRNRAPAAAAGDRTRRWLREYPR